MAITNKAKKAQATKVRTISLGSLATPLKSDYPDATSEFISELSGLITKWSGKPGKEAAAFAAGYKNMLCNFLTPEIAE